MLSWLRRLWEQYKQSQALRALSQQAHSPDAA
jgi:hypothetical protein